jgi:MFS family permease
MIILSTVVLLIAHLINMFLPDCDQCYSEIGPLVLVGIGYSIYAAALWGSIPYVVDAKTVGTAFGFVTAIQNAGMAIAPTIVGAIIDNTKEYKHGYFFASLFWVCICIIGIILNTWLYIEDIKNNGGQLNKVHHGDAIEDLLKSPTREERRKIEGDDEIPDNNKEYLLKKGARDALKRSMARRSMAK